MATVLWGRELAEHYDSTRAAMFAPEVLGPCVDVLAALAGGGAALEFAVGTGRVALPLRDRGVPVSGIELSPHMAGVLRGKPGGAAVPVTMGDMTSARAPGVFALVYLVFNTIMNVTTQDEQVAVFANAAAHLAAGGRFVVEVGVPSFAGRPAGELGRVFDLSPGHVGVDTLDDPVGQLMSSHHWTLIDGRWVKDSAPFRYVWPSELDLMGRLARFRLEHRWAGWDQSAFTASSTSQVAVYEKLSLAALEAVDIGRHRTAGGRGVAVDGFELAYDRAGSGPAVVLLHGWPGDRTDYRDLVPLLSGCEVVVPDLRGFGASDKHVADPAEQYSSVAQARGVADLIDSLGVGPAVMVGYDIGSRIAQSLARSRPDLVRALVISPPVPGVGTRVFGPGPLREFWYQAFHRLPLSAELIDGKPDAVRAYLRHFWEHWSGPAFTLAEEHLDHLVSVYGPPGAFTASVQWYRAGAGTTTAAAAETTPAPEDRLATPAVVLWPEHDPLFPREWSDRIDSFFSRARLRFVDGVGHYAPLEYPSVLAEEVRGFLPPAPR